MNTSRVKYSIIGTALFGLFLFVVGLWKNIQYYADKIECYKKERGCNPMKKDRLIVVTDAVLAIVMTILILELEKPTTLKSWSFLGIYGKILFACFLSFFLVGIVMDGTKHIMGKGWENFPEIIWWNLFLLLERQEFSLENSLHAIQDTSLNDVVDRIYINVKDLPFQSLGALALISCLMLRRDWFKTVIFGLSSSHFSNNISW